MIDVDVTTQQVIKFKIQGTARGGATMLSSEIALYVGCSIVENVVPVNAS
jgi:hypothetical protein